jgi:hypothetical protein
VGKIADQMNADALRKLKEQVALRILSTYLDAQSGKTLGDFGLDASVDLSIAVPDYNPDIHGANPTEYLNGNFSHQGGVEDIPVVPLGDEQQYAFNQIVASIQSTENEAQNPAPKLFFLHGAGYKVIFELLQPHKPILTYQSSYLLAPISTTTYILYDDYDGGAK